MLSTYELNIGVDGAMTKRSRVYPCIGVDYGAEVGTAVSANRAPSSPPPVRRTAM